MFAQEWVRSLLRSYRWFLSQHHWPPLKHCELTVAMLAMEFDRSFLPPETRIYFMLTSRCWCRVFKMTWRVKVSARKFLLQIVHVPLWALVRRCDRLFITWKVHCDTWECQDPGSTQKLAPPELGERRSYNLFDVTSLTTSFSRSDRALWASSHDTTYMFYFVVPISESAPSIARMPSRVPCKSRYVQRTEVTATKSK